LADPEIYDDSNKETLKQCLSKQAEVKKILVALEENWLETQEQIENMAEQ